MEEKEFFNRVRNSNYDFSNSIFIDLFTPIEVVCNIHGLFKIIPANMLYKGEGCRFCGFESMAKSKAMTRTEFILRSNKIHNGKYDYSLVDYKNNKTKVKIICKECGEIFEMTPYYHLKGYGCKCQKDLTTDFNKVKKEE
jgi:hypothetical protein